PNPFARYAHRSRLKLALNAAHKALPVGGTLLDYGSGQGAFLAELGNVLRDQGRRGERLVGYDPYMSAAFPNIEILPDLAVLSDKSMDCITVLEVCEHLDESETQE